MHINKLHFISTALLVAAILSGSGCKENMSLLPVKETSLPPISDHLVTPVLGEVTTQPRPVKLSDGKYHLMYELRVNNLVSSAMQLEKLVLQDPLNGNAVIAEFNAEDLTKYLHMQKPNGPTNVLKPNETGLINITLTIDADKLPAAIDHVLTVKTDKPSGIILAETTERIARIAVSTEKPVVIGPPLKGNGWVAVNVSDNYGHRNALSPIDGKLYVPERWAVDWGLLTDDNRFFSGDRFNLNNYPSYNQDLIAVKTGRVLKVVDQFDDLEIDGVLKNISFDNAGGNYVVLDIGDGYSAFYAHLIKGTVAVKEGDMVQKGQVIGKLGNTGNSTMPHLHFHVVKGTNAMFSDGVPYVIDNFNVSGQVTSDKIMEKGTLNGQILPITHDFTGAHSNEMVADLTVVNFPN